MNNIRNISSFWKKEEIQDENEGLLHNDYGYNYLEIKENIKKKIMQQVDMSYYVEDEEFRKIVKNIVLREKNEYKYDVDYELLEQDIFNNIRKFGPIQELLDNNEDEISEIMINGYNTIFYERKGQIIKFNKSFESEEHLMDVIQKMVSTANRSVNEANPIVDARLPDGSRINVVLPPVSLDGPTVTIRKFIKEKISLSGLVERGSISSDATEFLKKLVVSKYNIFISGGTGAGKTTFLNALSEYIPPDERIVTIEDSAELQINSIPNIVRLEVRNANMEGNKEISIRTLIKSALRMRPGRIIVGEVRDEAAIDLLSAYNTGHDGSLSTGHGNSSEDMISRLETMVLMGVDIPIDAIRNKIASAIDILIHIGRLRDRTRKVLEISEVLGFKDGHVILNKIYEFKEYDYQRKGSTINDNEVVKGKLVRTKNEFIHTEKLKRAGML